VPSPETVDKIVAAVRRGDAARYFFDRLSSPEWIRPLAERGLFATPPQPISIEDGKYIQFPVWSASRYLARVAGGDPEAVLDVANSIPDTGNPRVYEDLVDAGLSMPPALAARLVPRLRKWLQDPYQFLLPLKAGALLSHLARGGEEKPALALARELLAVQQEERQLPEEKEGSEEFSLPPEARPRFDAWDYERILIENVPDLVDVADIRALTLLCEVLDAAIRLSERKRPEGPEDYSWIWRPAIEDHEQNHDRTAKDFLVSAVRDSAARLVKERQVPLKEVVELFEGQRTNIFRRLVLDLLSRFPDGEPALLRSRLLDPELLDLPQVAHEFGKLLGSGFRHLSEQDRASLLARIEAGPDLSWFRERFEAEEDRAPTEDEITLREDRWRLDKLGLIGREDLPPEWQRRVEDLARKFGEPGREEFPFYLGSWEGDATPMSASELTEATVSEVVALLREWVPSGHGFEATREGLGTALAAAVKERAGTFAEEASSFVELDPIYVREFLRGLEEAVENGVEIAWEPVLGLCRWVLEQPREIPGRVERYSDLDPGWVWTRKAISDLLEAGLVAKSSPIPFGLRESTWLVLEPMTSDPDPEDSREVERLREADMSLNSIRGRAMHDVFLYCRWVKLAFIKADADREYSLQDMPEAERVLASRLNPEVERHSAIRSIYGWRYPLLLWLDEGWATGHRDEIFSRGDGRLDRLGQAAWDTYLRLSRLLMSTLDALRPQYELAVEVLEPTSAIALAYDDPMIGLAHHLMTFFWHGKLGLEDALVERFFASAPAELRGEAVKYLGRSLKDVKDDSWAAPLERLMALWDWRVASAERGVDRTTFAPEMEAFGWWLLSDKIPGEWAIRNLHRALLLTSRVDLDHPVMERVAALSRDFPREAIEVAQLMIAGDHQGWGVYSWRGDLRTIVAAAHDSDNPNSREGARDVVNELVVRGYPEFRELIS
jgi:hypothetical protein